MSLDVRILVENNGITHEKMVMECKWRCVMELFYFNFIKCEL